MQRPFERTQMPLVYSKDIEEWKISFCSRNSRHAVSHAIAKTRVKLQPCVRILLLEIPFMMTNNSAVDELSVHSRRIVHERAVVAARDFKQKEIELFLVLSEVDEKQIYFDCELTPLIS